MEVSLTIGSLCWEEGSSHADHEDTCVPVPSDGEKFVKKREQVT